MYARWILIGSCITNCLHTTNENAANIYNQIFAYLSVISHTSFSECGFASQVFLEKQQQTITHDGYKNISFKETITCHEHNHFKITLKISRSLLEQHITPSLRFAKQSADLENRLNIYKTIR